MKQWIRGRPRRPQGPDPVPEREDPEQDVPDRPRGENVAPPDAGGGRCRHLRPRGQRQGVVRRLGGTVRHDERRPGTRHHQPTGQRPQKLGAARVRPSGAEFHHPAPGSGLGRGDEQGRLQRRQRQAALRDAVHDPARSGRRRPHPPLSLFPGRTPPLRARARCGCCRLGRS